MYDTPAKEVMAERLQKRAVIVEQAEAVRAHTRQAWQMAHSGPPLLLLLADQEDSTEGVAEGEQELARRAEVRLHFALGVGALLLWPLFLLWSAVMVTPCLSLLVSLPGSGEVVIAPLGLEFQTSALALAVLWALAEGTVPAVSHITARARAVAQPLLAGSMCLRLLAGFHCGMVPGAATMGVAGLPAWEMGIISAFLVVFPAVMADRLGELAAAKVLVPVCEMPGALVQLATLRGRHLTGRLR